MKKAICFLILLYQKAISRHLPQTCRFYPSCSSYAIQAIEHFGLFKGGAKAFWRIMRCHPFSKGGYDPVK